MQQEALTPAPTTLRRRLYVLLQGGADTYPHVRIPEPGRCIECKDTGALVIQAAPRTPDCRRADNRRAGEAGRGYGLHVRADPDGPSARHLSPTELVTPNRAMRSARSASPRR